MNETSKQKADILRQRVPVGIQHALILLEKTSGDINSAEALFKEQILDTVVSKTAVAKEVALRHLIANNYNIDTALKRIDEERFTLPERIYMRYKDKEETLTRIMYVLIEQYHLEKNNWLDFKALPDLSPEAFCLLVIMEWIGYEDYESFNIALSFQLDIVTDQIENVLQLSSLASSLRRARDIMELIYKKNEVHSDIENYIKATRELKNDKAYQQYEQEYVSQRTLLISKLYDFVKINIRFIDRAV